MDELESKRLQRWRYMNAACAALALFVFASTFNSGRWGTHWAFLIAYCLAGLYCAWRRLYIALVCSATLIWLRLDLALGVGGINLRLASTAFAVTFFLLCVRKGDDLHWFRVRKARARARAPEEADQ